MKQRKILGSANIVGNTIEKLRKNQNIKQKDMIIQLQLNGIDINPTSYSKLEGQTRIATDKEIFVISKILKVDVSELFNS